MNSRPRVLVLALVCAAVAAILVAVLRTPAPPPPVGALPAPAAAPAAVPRPAAELTDSAPAESERERIESAPAPASERAPAAPSRDLEVRGRIVGADGAAVAGIECRIEHAYSKAADEKSVSMGSASSPLALARSGADGAFVIALAPKPGGRISWFQFTCRAPGQALISRACSVPDDALEYELGDLALLPGATVSGLVRDAEGFAIEGAQVRVALNTGADRWTGTGVSTPSNADGTFVIEGAPAGWLRLTASAPDGRDSAPFELTAHADEVRTGIVLELPIYEDPFAISGIVYDVDGAPLSKAPIRWSARTGNSTSSSSSQVGKDGRFRAQGVAGSVFRVTASHPKGEARAVSRVDIPAGTHGIELRLAPLLSIPLRVRSPDGAFVAQFTYKVDVRLDTFVQGGLPVESSPATPGIASIAVPAEPFVVEVSAVGFATERTPELEPETLPPSIDVVLRPLPVLRGRVVRGGEPVAGARVRAHRALRTTESMTKDVFDLSVALCEPCTEVTTSTDGSFVLPVAGEGRWQARAAAAGHPTTISRAVGVASGIVPEELRIDLGPRGSIAGRALDPSGTPLARRTIGASCGDGSPVTTVTGADGTYRFEVLAPGGWQVRDLEPQRARMHQSSSSMGDEDMPPIAWDCRVTDGAVTTYDVAVSGP